MKETMIVFWILFSAMSLFIYLWHKQIQVALKLRDELNKMTQTALDLQRDINDEHGLRSYEDDFDMEEHEALMKLESENKVVYISDINKEIVKEMKNVNEPI